MSWLEDVMNKVLRPTSRFDTASGQRTDMMRMLGGLDEKYGDADVGTYDGGYTCRPDAVTTAAMSTFTAVSHSKFFVRVKNIDRDFDCDGFTYGFDVGTPGKVVIQLYKAINVGAGSMRLDAVAGASYVGTGDITMTPRPFTLGKAISINKRTTYFIGVSYEFYDAGTTIFGANVVGGVLRTVDGLSPKTTGLPVSMLVSAKAQVLPVSANSQIGAVTSVGELLTTVMSSFAPYIRLNNAKLTGTIDSTGIATLSNVY